MLNRYFRRKRNRASRLNPGVDNAEELSYKVASTAAARRRLVSWIILMEAGQFQYSAHVIQKMTGTVSFK